MLERKRTISLSWEDPWKKHEERSKKYTDFSITVTDAPNGKLELSLNKAQTTALPDLVYYDLKANTGTEEKHLLTGEISVKEGYTAWQLQ